MNLNGGYAMIKYNSTQEELAVAYKSKRPALFYDENQRAHWAVIEETATQSVDEETQEPITLYQYSYRLLDEESGGSEVHLYRHYLSISTIGQNAFINFDTISTKSEPYTTSTLRNLGNMICTNTPTIVNYPNKYTISWFKNVNIGSSNNFSFGQYNLTFSNDGTITLGVNSAQQYILETVSDTVTEV